MTTASLRGAHVAVIGGSTGAGAVVGREMVRHEARVTVVALPGLRCTRPDGTKPQDPSRVQDGGLTGANR